MYDYFASISDFMVEEIRDNLIDFVTKNKEVIDSAVHITLEKRGSDINFWRLGIRHPGNADCEVTLYCLCKMFHKHIMVHTMGWYWTTVSHKLNESEEEVATKCDINLVYLGGSRYAVATKLDNTNVPKQTKDSSSIGDVVKGVKPAIKRSCKTKNPSPLQNWQNWQTRLCLTLNQPAAPSDHVITRDIQKCELRGTSEYINYSRYGRDSNTEEETLVRTTKKPRAGRWPSATRK